MLSCVKPLLGYSTLTSLSRQDAVVLRRLRIGHTRLTTVVHSGHLPRNSLHSFPIIALDSFPVSLRGKSGVSFWGGGRCVPPYLTHSYLLNRQDQPDCYHCYCALTIAHVLLECNHYNAVRQRYFNVSSLHDLFDTVDAQNILGFIRDIGLYRLL